MKTVLILGAGLSSNALIKYFVDRTEELDIHVRVGDISHEIAISKTKESKNSSAFEFDVYNEEHRTTEIKGADIVISMLPARMHPMVARTCVDVKKNMVTASYTSKEVKDLDEEAHKNGIVIMRDASANKCGVVSSSYEIIANLMLSEKEFLANKQRYVADVINILNQRAEAEALLIFRRHRECDGHLLYTEISDAISFEINGHYARLFDFFKNSPQLCSKQLYRKAILHHLPHILSQDGRFCKRIDALPEKIKYAILASEIASFIVYRGNEDEAYTEMVEGHQSRMSST